MITACFARALQRCTGRLYMGLPFTFQAVRPIGQTRNQLLPHLSMPKRGPKCKLGYYRVFNLILWVLYTGMQWKCLPIPHDTQGKPAIHYTTVYKVFAKWADDGSLWQAFVASVRHLAVEQQLDLSVLHGDGTNTVAKKGAMALASRDTNTRRARRSLPSSTTMARC
jgi:transposase